MNFILDSSLTAAFLLEDEATTETFPRDPLVNGVLGGVDMHADAQPPRQIYTTVKRILVYRETGVGPNHRRK